MKFADYVTRIFFPLKCPLCGELIPITENECSCCGDGIEVISKDFCRHCGSDTDNCTCNITTDSFLNNVAGVYYYSGKIKSQIALYKFSGKKSFANEFSLRMSERVASVFSGVNFDTVTYVPSSEKSMNDRGFNQSELLAKGVANRLFIPLANTLKKVKETEFQHSLSAKERASNLDGAFEVRGEAEIKGKTILLCDDIKTTGTTLKKCSEALYEKGAKEVYCIVLAVTDYLTDF